MLRIFIFLPIITKKKKRMLEYWIFFFRASLFPKHQFDLDFLVGRNYFSLLKKCWRCEGNVGGSNEPSKATQIKISKEAKEWKKNDVWYICIYTYILTCIGHRGSQVDEKCTTHWRKVVWLVFVSQSMHQAWMKLWRHTGNCQRYDQGKKEREKSKVDSSWSFLFHV